MQWPGSHSFPGALVLQLTTLVQRWGIAPDHLLEGTGLEERWLETPTARVSAETLRDLSIRARLLTGEPGIGLYLGLQKRLSVYGFLGFAEMHAATIRECLELAVRYAPIVTSAISLDLVADEQPASLVIHEHFDLGDARDIVLFSFLVGLYKLASQMIGRKADQMRIELAMEEPDYFQRFAHLLPEVRFHAKAVRLCFPAAGLDLRLASPDRAALELARQACDAQLRELGFERTLSTSVRGLLAHSDRFPTIDEVARRLRVSTRTLKRRLAAEALTFSELVDAARRERAERMLTRTTLSLEVISDRLGYTAPASFTRAFRRWTGSTPLTYRRTAQSSPVVHGQ